MAIVVTVLSNALPPLAQKIALPPSLTSGTTEEEAITGVQALGELAWGRLNGGAACPATLTWAHFDGEQEGLPRVVVVA